MQLPCHKIKTLIIMRFFSTTSLNNRFSAAADHCGGAAATPVRTRLAQRVAVHPGIYRVDRRASWTICVHKGLEYHLGGRQGQASRPASAAIGRGSYPQE